MSELSNADVPSQEDTKKRIQKEVDNAIEQFKDEVLTSGDVGQLSFWMSLLRKIMQWIQSSVKMKGLDKMEIALDSVKSLAQMLLDSNVANIDEKAASTLKTVLSEEGLGLMGAATSVIKDFMRKIDTDGDGEISMDECANLFSCCFPNKKKNSKK